MNYYIKLAWRNIFRNKRRTIISSIAIGVGLAALMVTDALMTGMKENMIRSATSSFLGEAQIHSEGFRAEYDLGNTIKNRGPLIKKIEENNYIDKYSKRVIAMGTVKSAEEIRPITLYGIDPSMESQVSKIDEAVKNGKGEFFKGVKATDIVIGSKLAERLKVSLGDRVVVTLMGLEKNDESDKIPTGAEVDMLEDEEGPVEEAFYVSGIYNFGIPDMDGGMVFIRIEKAQTLLNLGKGIHEIALKFHDIKNSTNELLPVWSDLGGNGNEFLSWAKLMASLKAVFDMSKISLAFTAFILFSMITFGIINTLLMSLFERMFEFGVLRAVGTRPGGIRKLILYEAGALSVISILVGLALGASITFIYSQTGVDYRGIEAGGITMNEILYPVFNINQYAAYPALVFLFTIFVGLYPAFIAGRMSITKALRKSL